jgi:hypothetical protein
MNRKKTSAQRHEHLGKIILIVLFCGVLPFLFQYGEWSKILAKVYLLTICIFFLVLYVHSRSISEGWFWKAMLLVCLLHSGIVIGVIALNLLFPQMDHMPRAVYGALTGLMVAEGQVSLSIIERFKSRIGSRVPRAGGYG